jgi:glycosyltransferase involved in cell wall biosynthesis
VIIGAITENLPYLPARDGFRVYEANVLAKIAQRHEVHLISLIREGDSEHLGWARRRFASVTGIPTRSHSLISRCANFASTFFAGKPLHYRSELANAISTGAKSQHWEVMHVAGEFVGGLIPSNIQLPMLLSLHDAYSLRCKQDAELATTLRNKTYFRILGPLEERYARLAFPRFSKCVYVADTDLDAVKKLGIANGIVIPNGVDTTYFAPTGEPVSENTLVFHGNLSYPPNVRAVLDIVTEVMPTLRAHLPDIVFRIAGANPVEEIVQLSRQGFVDLIATPPDIRPSLASAAVYICGVRFGTGLKNKLLEAMAMGKAIVTYEEGASGINCTEGEHMIIVNSPEEFAERTLELLRNKKRRDQLGTSARKLVESQFSWDSRALEFERLYLEATAHHQNRSMRISR